MKELLAINNLIVSFKTPEGTSTAVKGVSLKLAEGETLALVGESGCGKTVMCKSMLHILCEYGNIEGGEILLNREDLVKLSEKEMQDYRGGQIAMVFQDPMASLDPAFSVGEQIAEVLRIHRGLSGKDAVKQAVELMKAVKIDNAETRYNQRPYQFSGGMRQRIAIAIALAGDPALLLADEPTTALDEETQQEILKLLKEIQKKTGVSMLFITHDLSLVEDIADRVAIMQKGRIVEEGEVSKVFTSPGHPYTKKLLGYLDYKKDRGHNHREYTEGRRNIVSVRNISKSFFLDKKHKKKVLENFSMDIYEGEILGLVGASGSGKSTLSRCIMGIEKQDSGNIKIAHDIRTHMIFQDSQSAFNERMTVEEIIGEPLRIDKKLRKPSAAKEDRKKSRRKTETFVKQRVFDAMENAGLSRDLAARKPYELSGGQRQRVAIARALITEPDLIIADEPLTGLDVSSQAQMVHLFKSLSKEKNLTILFIAHDLPMVKHISSRVIKM